MNLNINGNVAISNSQTGSYENGNFSLVVGDYGSASLTLNVSGMQLITPDMIKQIINDPQFKQLLKEQIFKGTVQALIEEGEKK